MAESIPSNQPVPDTTSSTVTIVETDTQDSTEPTIHLKLKKPKNRKKVKWSNETVDNEGMNKKKSKCCCIYVKPKKFDESSSSSEDSEDEECDHCKGHIEKKKKHTDHSHNEGDLNHIDCEPSTSS